MNKKVKTKKHILWSVFFKFGKKQIKSKNDALSGSFQIGTKRFSACTIPDKLFFINHTVRKEHVFNFFDGTPFTSTSFVSQDIFKYSPKGNMSHITRMTLFENNIKLLHTVIRHLYWKAKS